MSVVTVTYCKGGALALQLPFAVWFGITVVGFFYSGEVALLCLSITYYPQLYINYVLKQALQTPYPDNGCRTGLDSPSLESQLAASFAVFVLLFNMLRGIRPKILTLLVMGAFWVGTPIVLVATGNSGRGSAWLGWCLGTLFGLLIAFTVHLYLSPHFDQMIRWLPLRKLGYRNTLYHCQPAGGREQVENIATQALHSLLNNV